MFENTVEVSLPLLTSSSQVQPLMDDGSFWAWVRGGNQIVLEEPMEDLADFIADCEADDKRQELFTVLDGVLNEPASADFLANLPGPPPIPQRAYMYGNAQVCVMLEGSIHINGVCETSMKMPVVELLQVLYYLLSTTITHG
jgi:hypothetical protein